MKNLQCKQSLGIAEPCVTRPIKSDVGTDRREKPNHGTMRAVVTAEPAPVVVTDATPRDDGASSQEPQRPTYDTLWA